MQYEIVRMRKVVLQIRSRKVAVKIHQYGNIPMWGDDQSLSLNLVMI